MECHGEIPDVPAMPIDVQSPVGMGNKTSIGVVVVLSSDTSRTIASVPGPWEDEFIHKSGVPGYSAAKHRGFAREEALCIDAAEVAEWTQLVDCCWLTGTHTHYPCPGACVSRWTSEMEISR